MNPDGAFGLQCVDVADDYAQAIHGVPWGQCFGGGNARDHFPKNNGYFTSIGYNGHNRPERGDIIIWGGDGSNPYGHIAVVASSTMSNVSVIQQNYNTGGAANKPASLDVMPYSAAGMGACVGWLRPNVPGATTPDPGEVVLGNGAAGGAGGVAVVTRSKEQRWAVESCDVLEAPRPGAKKVGSISKDDLVTMGGYVLGEWVSWNGRGSSFWFKPTSKGGATRGGGGDGSGTVLDGMDWDKLAMLESSGNWQCNTGNGFYGGIQFTYTTWLEFGGGKYADRADHATREQQIEIGRAVLKGQGVMAWPNTGPKCYNPGAADSGGSGGDSGTATGSTESLSGYVPFVYFDPQETYGVPDQTPYDTWTTKVPDPPKLPADAPEAHWDGNTWQGWQWNTSRTQVVWVTPNGHVYDGAYSAGQSGNAGTATMYPEPLPNGGPVSRGSVSESMWNYLLAQGWGTVTDPNLLTVSYQEMTGGYDPANTAALGAWYWLQTQGWKGIPGDREERLYAPAHPRYGETRRVFAPTPVQVFPVAPGSDVTNHVGDILLAAGWRWRDNMFIIPPEQVSGVGINVSLLTVSYREMTGGYDPANTAALGAWYWLQTQGWKGIPTDKEERLYAPTHPRYGETRRVVEPSPVQIFPVMVGSDVTHHVGDLLLAAGWRWRDNNFIIAP